MHVGWVAVYDPPEDGPSPTFAELFAHLAGRLEHAPRYRQRLAHVPFGLHEPVWVDDPGFDPAEHLLPADGERPQRDRRRRPLHAARARPAAVGDVDRGLAAGRPHRRRRQGAPLHGRRHRGGRAREAAARRQSRTSRTSRGEAWTPAPAPSAAERLARAVSRPRRRRRVARPDPGAPRGAPARAPRPRAPRRPHALAHAAPARARLAAEPPGLAAPPPRPPHALARRAARDPQALPRQPQRRRDRHLRRGAAALRRAARRDAAAAEGDGARGRARHRGRGQRQPHRVHVHRPALRRARSRRARCGPSTARPAQRARDGEAEDVDAAFQTLALTPRPLQRALAHAFAHPRLSNLTISSVAAAAPPRYMRGCRLREVHSAIPLAGRHALSIGVVMVAGQVCFAVLADAETLPDADALGDGPRRRLRRAARGRAQAPRSERVRAPSRSVERSR